MTISLVDNIDVYKPYRTQLSQALPYKYAVHLSRGQLNVKSINI